MKKNQVKVGPTNKPEAEPEVETKPKTIKSKRSDWITEKMETWRWRIMLISIFSTIMFTTHATLIFHTQGVVLIFWFDLVLLIFCLIASEVLMYEIYDEKKVLELQVWIKLNENLTKNLGNVITHLQNLESLKLFHETYRDSFWIRHTPPFALIIYLGYTISLPTIWLKMNWVPWIDQFTFISLLVLFLLFNVKFINDLFNLTMGYRKMKTLKKII